MRSIYFDRGSVAPSADNAVEDLRLASAILLAAASAAEAEIATHTWSPGVRAAASSVQGIIKACNAFETAITAPVHMPSPSTRASIAAVSAVSATMPSAETLKSIATVEAARAAMPDERTHATIARVEAVRATMPSLEVRKAINAAAAADAAFESSDHALAKTQQPFSNL
jgi:hypothetical protein